MTNQITATTDAARSYGTSCAHWNVLTMTIPVETTAGLISYTKRICQDCGAEVSCYD